MNKRIKKKIRKRLRECLSCGYTWMSGSRMKLAGCPSCGLKRGVIFLKKKVQPKKRKRRGYETL